MDIWMLVNGEPRWYYSPLTASLEASLGVEENCFISALEEKKLCWCQIQTKHSCMEQEKVKPHIHNS